MRADQLKSFLKELYEAEQGKQRTGILILGGSGIGKSMTVLETAQEIAQSNGKKFVDYDDKKADEILNDPKRYFVFHNLPLVGVEVVDLVGHPKLVDDKVRYYPLIWAEVMSKTSGILFLDDFLDTQRPDILSASYRIFLERRAGYVHFHPDVMIIAASNTPEYSSLSQLMPAPLINRICVINLRRPTVDEWARWMDRHYNSWDKSTYAFLKRFELEDYLFKPPKEAESLKNFPSPRQWTRVATLQKMWIRNPEIVAGLIGEEMAQRFKAFLDLSIDLDELIGDPQKFDELSLDAKYMATIMLGTALTSSESPERYIPILDKMCGSSRDFIVTTFIAIPRVRRGKILKALVEKRTNIGKILEQVVYDREAIM